MRLLDLFAGIGGFSLAAHWMGWETAAFVERDKFCQKVLRKNFGQDIDIHDDIFRFSGRPFRGAVDIISGGFPCQPFSAAGNRNGRNDERHLWPEMFRVIQEVRPRWIVAENVRGLLSIEAGAIFADIIASLESEDYEVVTFCIPASSIGAPHRRDRLWIVARSRGILSADAVQREPRFYTRANGKTPKALRRQEPSDLFAGPLEYRNGDDYVTHAVIEGLQGSELSSTSSERTRPSRPNTERIGNDWHEPWIDVAARTCVRRVDDGLSDELHIIGSRDNRVNRLKALGNSIVPQIAFEIFQTINEVENG